MSGRRELGPTPALLAAVERIVGRIQIQHDLGTLAWNGLDSTLGLHVSRTHGGSVTCPAFARAQGTDEARAAKRFVSVSKPPISRRGLRPQIAKTFPFDKIADAHRYLESNEQLGKVVVMV